MKDSNTQRTAERQQGDEPHREQGYGRGRDDASLRERPVVHQCDPAPDADSAVEAVSQRALAIAPIGVSPVAAAAA